MRLILRAVEGRAGNVIRKLRVEDSVEEGSEGPVRARGKPAGRQSRVLADRWGERDDCREI